MEVRTQEEFDRVLRFEREIGNDFWLKGSDREVEGEWRWESNDEFIDMNKFWLSEQPFIQGGDHDCLVMWGSGFGYSGCSAKKNFVCEFD